MRLDSRSVQAKGKLCAGKASGMPLLRKAIVVSFRQECGRLLTAYDGHLYADAAVNRADVSFKVGRDGEQRTGISRDKESRKSLSEQFRSTRSVLSGQQGLAVDRRLRVKGNLDVSNLSGTLTDHDYMLNVSLLFRFV